MMALPKTYHVGEYLYIGKEMSTPKKYGESLKKSKKKKKKER